MDEEKKDKEAQEEKPKEERKVISLKRKISPEAYEAACDKLQARREHQLGNAIRESMGEDPLEMPEDCECDCEECAFNEDESYDHVCDACGGKEEEEFPEEWIRSPIKEHEEFPMVLMRSGTYWYIGAWLGLLKSDEAHILGYPLVLAEMMDHSVQGQSQVSLMMNKMFYSLAMHERMTIRYDTMIFLESAKQKDKELARIYGNAVEKLSIESAGLIPATAQDIMNITRGKPQGNA